MLDLGKSLGVVSYSRPVRTREFSVTGVYPKPEGSHARSPRKLN
jgi:hypothetical protein